MSKEERFELSCCLFNESDMDFIRDKKTNEEYVVLDELVPILNQQDQTIADLEAKLADKEAEHELLIDQFEEETEKLRKQIKQESDARKRFVEEVKNLKQQLAEKDKLIEDYSTYFNQLFNQDKISFAVEQVEWLKEKINNAKIHKINMINTHELYEILDNQIKQLKEMK